MNLKRVFAGVAAAATMLGGLALGATTANAAPTDTSITVNNAQPGHTYTAYKFANITPLDGGGYDVTTLTTPDTVSPALYTALKTAAALQTPPVTPQSWWSANPAAAVATLDNAALRQFADALKTNVADLPQTGTSLTIGETAKPTTGTITNLTEGWYAVADSNGPLAIVATPINGETTLPIKTPHEQGQYDINANGTFNAKAGEQLVVMNTPKKSVDQPEVSAGDTVAYTVTDTIPETAKMFNGFTYSLTDTPAQGISIVSGSAAIDGETSSYPFTQGTGDDAKTWTVTIPNAEKFAGKKVTLTYTAKITAEIAASNVAANSVYSNGSYVAVGEEEPTTVQSQAAVTKVFTNDFTLKKVDASGNPLTGAKFIISKTVDSGTDSETTYYGIYKDSTWSWTATEAQATRFMDDNASEVTFNNLAIGTYTITETQVPNGFAASFAQPFQITVTRTGDEKVATSLDGSDTFGLVTLDNTNSENPVITVKNVQNVTQLPLTGAAGITMLVVVALLIGGAAALIAVRSRSLKRQLNA
ncbi:SpaA isopeptide-forming pilin-related protein [Bifidobacterium pseudolongum]|uniref:SpaA isopeptide-forming pilin-related protein n=1 Tax=Bifidobacterium pseudolongum TaxID=1694 RepID=UPI003F92F42A